MKNFHITTTHHSIFENVDDNNNWHVDLIHASLKNIKGFEICAVDLQTKGATKCLWGWNAPQLLLLSLRVLFNVFLEHAHRSLNLDTMATFLKVVW